MTTEEFERQCQAEGKLWRLIALHDGQHAHFQFTGNFEGKPQIWDAHLYTLAYYFNKVVETSQSPLTARQFIDVGELTNSARQITIAHNLPLIDEPAITKTIIMVRQYKRLARGRYEYGETVRVI